MTSGQHLSIVLPRGFMTRASLTEGCVERRQVVHRSAPGRGVCSLSVERGSQGHSEGEPEGTEGTEDDEGEGVADNPLVKLVLMSEDEETGLSFRQTGFTYFSDRTEDHEDAAE